MKRHIQRTGRGKKGQYVAYMLIVVAHKTKCYLDAL